MKHNSDPLPFVQVDRAVKPKASLLAGALGVSPQHAIGSLVEWWDLCGDPRDLEIIVERTPPGIEPAVVLTTEDAALRFRLASGHQVEPVVLARLGLLEELGPSQYRVRGMSRYFAPIVARITARRNAAKGGEASVVARKKAHGTAQPGSWRGSTHSEAPAEAVTEAPPKRSRSATEADSNTIGQRTAVSGQLEDLCPPLVADHVRAAPNVAPAEDENSRWDLEARDFVAWASAVDPCLATPGPAVTEWARNFFAKHEPNPELVRKAFMSFVVWASSSGKTVGWGLWLSDRVWEPRWAEVRAEARGAA